MHWKILGPLLGGMVVGAAAAEIISQRNSKLMKKIRRAIKRGVVNAYMKTIETLSDATEAFGEGYRSATQPAKAAAAHARA
jgi:hypothetical protein